MKKINYYYLVAGFLALLFSITHELNGQRALIPAPVCRGIRYKYRNDIQVYLAYYYG